MQCTCRHSDFKLGLFTMRHKCRYLQSDFFISQATLYLDLSLACHIFSSAAFARNTKDDWCRSGKIQELQIGDAIHSPGFRRRKLLNGAPSRCAWTISIRNHSVSPLLSDETSDALTYACVSISEWPNFATAKRMSVQPLAGAAPDPPRFLART